MKIRTALTAAFSWIILSGCALLAGGLCQPHCRGEAHASSGLVGYLYPQGEKPPTADAIPQLKLPVRVGLAFLPASGTDVVGLEAARREELLERIRRRFADRKFVSEIVIVPDYYLQGRSGFEGLIGVQRLHSVDLMALVSYDQVTYTDENAWSLGYLTIVGAYVFKGNRHDVTTLMDLAVVDPATRSIVLRAGGTDSRHGSATYSSSERATREARAKGFSLATDQLIEHFDGALTRFEADVRAGKANVRVADREGARGGGGAFDVAWLGLLAVLLVFRRLRVAVRH